ncbi:MAG: hypothetical protein ACYTGX_16940, partial [Planctomycetota bacterium]
MAVERAPHRPESGRCTITHPSAGALQHGTGLYCAGTVAPAAGRRPVAIWLHWAGRTVHVEPLGEPAGAVPFQFSASLLGTPQRVECCLEVRYDDGSHAPLATVVCERAMPVPPAPPVRTPILLCSTARSGTTLVMGWLA